jgi:hypothetical protein
VSGVWGDGDTCHFAFETEYPRKAELDCSLFAVYSRGFLGSRLSASGRDGSPLGRQPDSPAGGSPHSYSLD